MPGKREEEIREREKEEEEIENLERRGRRDG